MILKSVFIIAIVAVAMIGVMIPNDVFTQQKNASMSISANPILTERYGNEFTVNFDGELRDNGKIYWYFSGSGGSGLEILPTNTTSWTKTLSSTGQFTIGNTQFFEIKNGAYSEKFEFTVISKEKDSIDLKTTVSIFDKCENELWEGHFEDEHTGEQIKNAKVFLYDDKGIRTKIFSLYSDGSFKIFPNGNDSYPAISFAVLRVENYEDLSFTPECVGTPEIPSWVKQTASWWSMNVITDNEFISMIQFLIESELIIISHTSNVSENNIEIPSWIKSSAGWWAEDIIDDVTFLKSIEFLVSNGIINIPTNDEEIILEIIECHEDSIIPSRIKVSMSATSQIDSQVDIEYIVHALDSNFKTITLETGYIFDLNPHTTQYDISYIENVSGFEHCALTLNSIHDYSLP